MDTMGDPSGLLPEGRAPSLAEAVAHAFSVDGPVQRRLGQHRPFQAEAANGFAAFSEAQYSESRVRLFIQEQRAGIGKTLAVATVMAFDAILNGNRGMISTSTKALRRNYLQIVDDVNWIVRTTLAELGYQQVFFPIVIEERTSVTQNISPSKIANLKKRLANNTLTHVAQHDELIEYFDSALRHGDEPNFDDFYYDFGGALPEGTFHEDWCMCSTDTGHVISELIRERNNGAITAHIVLVTHSMAVRNSLSRGRVLNTNLIGDDDFPPPSGMFVVDEADKMTQVAFEAQSPTTTLLTIGRILVDACLLYGTASDSTKEAVGKAVEKTEAGLEFFEEWIKTNTALDPAVVVEKDDFIATEIIDNLTIVNQGLLDLKDVVLGRYSPADRDVMLADNIARVQEILQAIRDFKFYPVPVMSLRTFTNQDDKRDLEITINLGLGRWLINQYWRLFNGVQTHSFQGVIAISATLADMPPKNHDYRWFRSHFGYDSQVDFGLLVQKPPIPANRREPYGTIKQVIVPEREGAPHPSNPEREHMIEPKFVQFAATALTKFAALQDDRPETRMLVLFPSYSLIDAFHAAVPNLHDRIIARQKGSNLYRDIEQFSRTPSGIFFGVDWEGVNFVDPEPPHRTLVDFLVLTKIPHPPSDHIRISRLANSLIRNFHNEAEAAKRKAFGISLMQGAAHAFRKMSQGVGRAIRNATDTTEAVLILDYRFPVPRHVAETRRIIRSGGKGHSLYGNFDSMFDPYKVDDITWSKMELTGEIVRLYPVTQ